MDWINCAADEPFYEENFYLKRYFLFADTFFVQSYNVGLLKCIFEFPLSLILVSLIVEIYFSIGLLKKNQL